METKKYRFNEKADNQLEQIYLGLDTVQQKIQKLDEILGGESHFYGTGGSTEVSDEQKLGCLEYEYLSNIGLIELELF